MYYLYRLKILSFIFKIILNIRTITFNLLLSDNNNFVLFTLMYLCFRAISRDTVLMRLRKWFMHFLSIMLLSKVYSARLQSMRAFK